MSQKATLTLEDGTQFEGSSFGHLAATSGEVVFNTGMVGYPETLTDPSYRGQILVLTYPLIGNYGVPPMNLDDFGLPAGFESERIQVSGLIVSEASRSYSHHSATRSLPEWLETERICGIDGIDTRALTKHLRDQGTMLGRIEYGEEEVDFFDPNAADMGSQVCCKEPVLYTPKTSDCKEKPARVMLLDCGCKTSIIRCLLQRGIEVHRVPHTYYYLNMDFDGLIISNGPGDPKMYSAATENIRRTLSLGKPIFGICLGNQLLSRALGADTFKLKFGHRGHNQPCVRHGVGGEVTDRPCVITSQNHGFAVRPEGLPHDWRVWYTNANDGTVEGIRHISKPFFAVQFHPEAAPGPEDTADLFNEFVQLIRGNQ